MTVIDTLTDTVVATVALGGVSGFALADGAGRLYINLTDQRAISRVDTKSARVTASWPMTDCDEPHGLSMDSG